MRFDSTGKSSGDFAKASTARYLYVQLTRRTCSPQTCTCVEDNKNARREIEESLGEVWAHHVYMLRVDPKFNPFHLLYFVPRAYCTPSANSLAYRCRLVDDLNRAAVMRLVQYLAYDNEEAMAGHIRDGYAHIAKFEGCRRSTATSSWSRRRSGLSWRRLKKKPAKLLETSRWSSLSPVAITFRSLWPNTRKPCTSTKPKAPSSCGAPEPSESLRIHQTTPRRLATDGTTCSQMTQCAKLN